MNFKFEARISKFETISKFKFRIFYIVSYFVF